MRPRPQLLLFLFGLLLATVPAYGKGGRGGGGSSSDGDSGSGSSDSGGDSGGSSPKDPYCSGTEKQTPTDLQKAEIYTFPGSYYNGTLTMTHRFTRVSDTVLNQECGNDNLGVKTYTYDAVLMVGPRTAAGNGSDSNSVHWSLRAFQPRYYELYRGSSNSPIRKIQGRQREVVRLESAANETNLRRFNFDPRYRPYESTLQTCWETAVNVSSGQGGGNITSWDLEARYTRVAEYLEESPNQPKYPLSSSNFVTFQDVCAQEFQLDTIERGVYMPYSPISSGGEWKSTIATVFVEPGQLNATIRGAGSQKATFTLKNGRLDTASGGSEYDLRESNECEPYEAGFQNLEVFKEIGSSRLGNTEFFNVTGSFEVEFEGELDVAASAVFLNATEAQGMRWGERSEGERIKGVRYWNLILGTALWMGVFICI